MAGEDAVIRVGADIAGAIAGLTSIQFAFKSLDKVVLATAATVRTASLMMVASIGAVGGALAILSGYILRDSINTFEEYEQQVANAASVTGTAGQVYIDTKANIDAISKTLGATTVFSAQAAASAMYDLASAGYKVGAMVSGDLKPVMDLAAATQSDLTQTTEIVTATLGQFQLGIKDSKRVSDIFAKTIGSSKATLEKLGLSFKYVGTIANQFDDSIEDVAAALAVMYNNGLRGEQAGRALRIAYARLANPTAAMIDILDDLGLSLEDINVKEHGMTKVLTNLSDAGMSVGQTMKFFGVEAGTGMGAVIDNLPHLEELEQKLYNSGKAAEDMAKKQLDTLRGSLILLKSVIENTKIEIGQRFAPFVDRASERLRDLVLAITDKVQPAFNRFLEILVSLEPTIQSVVSIATSMYGIFQDIAAMLPSSTSMLDTLVSTINKVAIALAIVMKYIDEHPKIVQFGLAIATTVLIFSWLYPAIIAASTAIGLFTTLYATMVFVMTGSIPVIGTVSTLLLTIEWPLVLIAAAIALLASVWIFNLGGIRDFTVKIVDDIKDTFWDMVDTAEHYINVLAQMYNDLIDKLGIDAPKIGLIDWEDYAKESIQKVKDVFDVDLGIGEYLDLPDVHLDDLMSEKTIYDEINAVTEEINENLIEQTNINKTLLSQMYEQQEEEKRIRKSVTGGDPFAYESALTFETAADVQAAREAGKIRAGDTYIVIENMNTKADVDEGLEEITDAARTV